MNRPKIFSAFIRFVCGALKPGNNTETVLHA